MKAYADTNFFTLFYVPNPDVPRLSGMAACFKLGLQPSSPGNNMKDHRLIDERSLVFSRLIADKFAALAPS